MYRKSHQHGQHSPRTHAEAASLGDFTAADHRGSNSFQDQDDITSLLISGGLAIPVCIGIESVVYNSSHLFAQVNMMEASSALMCLVAPQLINTFKHLEWNGSGLRVLDHSSEEIQQLDAAFAPLLMQNMLWLHAIYGTSTAPLLGLPVALHLLADINDKQLNVVLKGLVPALCGAGLFAQMMAQYHLWQDVPGSLTMLVLSMYAQAAVVPLLIYEVDTEADGTGAGLGHRTRQMISQALLCVALLAQLQVITR